MEETQLLTGLRIILKNAQQIILSIEEIISSSSKNVERLYELQKNIQITIPYSQLDSIEGENGLIENLVVRDLDNKKDLKLITSHHSLVYQGLRSYKRSIRNWKKRC